MSSPKNHSAIALSVLVLTATLAAAAPIDPNITITGSVTLDTNYTAAFDDASLSGTLTSTVGGTTSTTDYSDTGTGLVVGANPLSGALTDTGDGFGATGVAAAASSAPADGEFEAGIDIVMSITNNSALDIFQVTILTTFSNSVDSTGDDAYTDSEFTLDQRLSTEPLPGTEEFFSALITDTVNGNEVGGNPVAGLGGPLSETGTDTLVLTLNPGETYIVDGDWTLAGGAFFNPGESAASLEGFSVAMTVQDVIPEPATLTILAVSGLAIAVRRRR
jgi:hypothetical protein